jgi:hypothetical protein
MRALALLLLLLLSAASPARSAAPCTLGSPTPLEQPIDVQAHLLSKDLTDAVFWQTPSFQEPGDFDPAVDRLEIRAFHVHAGEVDLSVWGARVKVVGKPLELGFRDSYLPSMGGFMRLKIEDGKDIYAANDGQAPVAAELVTFVRDGKLRALAMAAPAPGGGRQVLCLRSARLKPEP